MGERVEPQQKRSRETVGKIIDAAEQLFASHGFHDTPMSQIIEVSGVRAGSIYRFFPDKIAIAEALVERHYEAMGPLAEPLTPAADLPELLAIIDIVVDLAAAHQKENPGFRAAADIFSVTDSTSPIYAIRQAQVNFLVGLADNVGQHVPIEDKRRSAGYMAEIIDALLRAVTPNDDDDRAARITATKQVLRAYVTDALG